MTVPEGAETVTVTYNKDVDIRHDGTTDAYCIRGDCRNLAVDGVALGATIGWL